MSATPAPAARLSTPMRKPQLNPPSELPPLEQQCMKVLWSLGQGTVHEVRGRLFPRRPLAYTTVMTVLQRLARKGVLGRERKGRRHLYRPLMSEELFREHAINRLAADFFGGSREHLKAHLATGPAASFTDSSPPFGARVRPGAAPARQRSN